MRASALMIVVAGAVMFAQTAAGPTFDVVSIKRHIPEPGPLGLNSTQNQRPDGGFTMTNIPAAILISRAYPPVPPVDMVGLPSWAMSERYNVSATSTLAKATPDQRAAMMRAMLADRFKLVAHFEKRELPVYDLLLARSDGKLGPGLAPSENDCAARQAAQRAAAEAGAPPSPPPVFDPNAPPPPCTFRLIGPQMTGENTIAGLAGMLRAAAGRLIVDKTGLTGSYRVTMTYDRMASLRGPEVAAAPDAAPSVFTAVREQLGLKLESSTAERDTLIIDRLERPSEN